MKYFNVKDFKQRLKNEDVKKSISKLILSKHNEFMEKDYETSLSHYKRTRELFPQSISANNKIK